MAQASRQTPTFDSGHAYTPKFELWMNGIVWQAIYNVINSYNTVEMESENVPQAGIMRTFESFPRALKRQARSVGRGVGRGAVPESTEGSNYGILN